MKDAPAGPLYCNDPRWRPAHFHVLAADGRTPVHEPDFTTWAEWWRDRDGTIAEDTGDDYHVLTIFYGVNRNSQWPLAPKELFVTLFFSVTPHPKQWYATYDEAIAGHTEAVAALQAGK